MTGSAFRAVAPVSAVCTAFRAQPSVYPLGAEKRTLRRCAAQKFDRSPAQRVQSKEEMRQTWNTPKWEEFGDFGRRGEKAG